MCSSDLPYHLPHLPASGSPAGHPAPARHLILLYKSGTVFATFFVFPGLMHTGFTALSQWSVVLSYDKVWDVFRWKQGIHSVFQRTQKIRTLLLLEKSSDFVVVVHSRDSNPGPTD